MQNMGHVDTSTLLEKLTRKSDFVFLGKYIFYTSVGDLKMG